MDGISDAPTPHRSATSQRNSIAFRAQTATAEMEVKFCNHQCLRRETKRLLRSHTAGFLNKTTIQFHFLYLLADGRDARTNRF